MLRILHRLFTALSFDLNVGGHTVSGTSEIKDQVRAVAAMKAQKPEKVHSFGSIEIKGRKAGTSARPSFPTCWRNLAGRRGDYVADALESVPDEAVDLHLFWLAEKLGRTLFSMASRIAALREMPKEWKNQLRKFSDDIRKSG